MNVQKIIDEVRSWESVPSQPDDVYENKSMTNLIHDARYRAALEMLVALVDEVERLQKKVKSLKRTADMDDGYIEFLEGKKE